MQKAASQASKKAVNICQMRKRKKPSESTNFPTTTTLQRKRTIEVWKYKVKISFKNRY